MLHPLKQAFLGLCLPGLILGMMPGATAMAKARETHPLERDINSLVRAKSALLVDEKTGEVIFARNAERELPPASTVKMLTALLVYETKGLGGNLVVSPEDKAEPSNVPLIPGETVAVRDLMYSLLLGSDNDSAIALARYTGGNVQNFINMMNNRAIRLGCRNSNFKTPNGLPTPGQYTTSEDLMKIFEAFVRVPELRRIASTKTFFLKTAARSQTLKNHNKLLGVYNGMGPAKTGWTYASQHTYAAAAMRNGRELHLTILDSPNKWADATALFDYGFAHLPVDPTTVPATTTAAATAPAPAPAAPVTLTAPITPAAPAAVPTPTPAPAPTSTPAPAPVEAPRPANQTHVIRKGETLTSIAQAYDCSVTQLTRVNQISDPRSLQPGQKLRIP